MGRWRPIAVALHVVLIGTLLVSVCTTGCRRGSVSKGQRKLALGVCMSTFARPTPRRPCGSSNDTRRKGFRADHRRFAARHSERGSQYRQSHVARRRRHPGQRGRLQGQSSCAEEGRSRRLRRGLLQLDGRISRAFGHSSLHGAILRTAVTAAKVAMQRKPKAMRS